MRARDRDMSIGTAASQRTALADRRPQAFEVECLRRPFDDNSLSWIAQAIATCATCSLQPSEYLTSMLSSRTFAHTTRPRLRKVSCSFKRPAFFPPASSSPPPGPELPLPDPELPPWPELPPEPLPDPELPEPLPDPELPPEPLPDPELPLVPPEPLLPELDPPLPDPLAAALMPQPNTVRAARPRPSLRKLRLVHIDRLVTEIDHPLHRLRTDVGRLINIRGRTLARRVNFRERFRTFAPPGRTLVGELPSDSRGRENSALPVWYLRNKRTFRSAENQCNLRD